MTTLGQLMDDNPMITFVLISAAAWMIAAFLTASLKPLKDDDVEIL